MAEKHPLSSPLPGSCGIQVFHNFGHVPSHDNLGTNYEPTAKQITSWLDENETFLRNCKKAFAMATLTRAQEKAIGHIFEKRGWKRVSEGINPVWKNATVGVWLLYLQEGLDAEMEPRHESEEVNFKIKAVA